MTIFNVTVSATQAQSSKQVLGVSRNPSVAQSSPVQSVKLSVRRIPTATEACSPSADPGTLGKRITVAQGQASTVRLTLALAEIDVFEFTPVIEVNVGRFVRPPGIASTSTRFGIPTLILAGRTVYPVGIASTAAFGTPTVGTFAEQFIGPVGWAEAELLGIPAVSHSTADIQPGGIPPSSAVGEPILLQSQPAQSVPRNLLIDRQTREIYPWPLNHATEDSVKTLGRRLTRSGISASGKLIQTRKVFLIRHPSHPGPLHLILHGTFLDRDQSQYQTFIRFFNECDNRTFDYIDASGDSYHVQLVQFDARRKIAPSRVDGSYFTYSLEVEVIDVNQGAYAGYVV